MFSPGHHHMLTAKSFTEQVRPITYPRIKCFFTVSPCYNERPKSTVFRPLYQGLGIYKIIKQYSGLAVKDQTLLFQQVSRRNGNI
jgi:hypothetical protein